jgi:hypothetical protein
LRREASIAVDPAWILSLDEALAAESMRTSEKKRIPQATGCWIFWGTIRDRIRGWITREIEYQTYPNWNFHCKTGNSIVSPPFRGGFVLLF